MILKHITVQNLGAVDCCSYDLSSDLAIVEGYCLDELAYSIRFVLNHKMPPLPNRWVRANTKIEAVVLVDKKEYRIIAAQNERQKHLGLRCYDADGADRTEEYLYLSSHCAEHDVSDVFCGGEEESLLKLLQYANEDLYYFPNELSRQTGGLSNLKTFRKYLSSYINSFEPERIRDGKQYEIVLTNKINLYIGDLKNECFN